MYGYEKSESKRQESDARIYLWFDRLTLLRLVGFSIGSFLSALILLVSLVCFALIIIFTDDVVAIIGDASLIQRVVSRYLLQFLNSQQSS